MNKRQTNALQSRLHKHAAKGCSNHTGSDGCLITMHGKCVLSFAADRVTANVCPYYMKAVGPNETKLFEEYLQFFPKNYPLKPKPKVEYTDKCAKCGKGYPRKSNRQIYCTNCTAEIRREKERIRAQERRAGIVR